METGRRYHVSYGGDKNLMPTDEVPRSGRAIMAEVTDGPCQIERERLDIHHELFLLLLDGQLYKAPLEEPVRRVLDLGTGTGIWAIEYAIENPEAEVIGLDLRYHNESRYVVVFRTL